ncbi:large subunit GTPase 1 homolog isoform X4 [Halichondria panicea]|uniref:large subunit GTPase 1 homolog isoform X4 n=1 Tax=Halichondria panicea TaxID=6063 RepID=UPI00312BBB1D
MGVALPSCSQLSKTNTDLQLRHESESTWKERWEDWSREGHHQGQKQKEKRCWKSPGRQLVELEDGYEWGHLNLRSVTEESRLDEFLNTAKLAGTEFTAEKLNIRVVDFSVYTGLPSASEYAEIEQAQKDHQEFLCIPRRPHWDSTTTRKELDQLERDSFLEWRRGLVVLEENEKLVLTPFERNLEFWRQLWRVIERSDVVVQIVDARNPLLFRCEDLEKYVKEIKSEKVNVVLISKSDLLTLKQRQEWLKYFTEDCPSLTVAFWSATMETERLQQLELLNSLSPSPVLESGSEPGSESNLVAMTLPPLMNVQWMTRQSPSMTP